jgi:tocopherol cyclase
MLKQSTPHQGYHWDGVASRFFEGWYYRVILPEIKQSFGFMYSIDDPLGNRLHSGGAVQILGIDDQYFWRTFPDVNGFWASQTKLELGHWGKNSLKTKPCLLSSEKFTQFIQEGYQATDTLNQGTIYDPSSQQTCQWCYEIKPIYGWGKQQATAGLLSYLPIFDPGWQILMAHGLATGWINWKGQMFHFKDAPAYSEKNWGRSFPQKWFWLNSNYFNDYPDLAITAVGSKRRVLGMTEDVGLIGIHYQGKFYEFVPWNAQIHWKIEPWGQWEMTGDSEQYHVKIMGNTDKMGNWVRVPTEEGLGFHCRDTTQGNLQIILKSKNSTLLLNAFTEMGGLEIGGSQWNYVWTR